METFGAQLRAWRHARRQSQEQLAARAGVSTRHLSFVENGRSQPSRDLVLALGHALDLPLRECNVLLTAAGFAAAYRASALEAKELDSVRRALDHVLEQQEPFGALVLDGAWNVVRLNRGAQRLLSRFPPRSPAGIAALGNVVLASMHPDALRPYCVNWEAVASHLVARLHREVAARPGDEQLGRLLATVLALPDVPESLRGLAPDRTSSAGPFLPVHLRTNGLEVRLFTMLSSLGTPLDVTAQELHIETYFPADEASENALRALS